MLPSLKMTLAGAERYEGSSDAVKIMKSVVTDPGARLTEESVDAGRQPIHIVPISSSTKGWVTQPIGALALVGGRPA